MYIHTHTHTHTGAHKILCTYLWDDKVFFDVHQLIGRDCPKRNVGRAPITHNTKQSVGGAKRKMQTKPDYVCVVERSPLPMWVWLLQCACPLQLSEVLSQHLKALLKEIVNAVALPHHRGPSVTGAIPVAVGDVHLFVWGRTRWWGQDQ